MNRLDAEMGYMPPGPPSYGEQYIFGEPKGIPPTTPYRRCIWDLYGESSRDWLPFLGWALVLDIIALVIRVVLVVTA